jgi:hypothetical protein
VVEVEVKMEVEVEVVRLWLRWKELTTTSRYPVW